MKIPRLRLKTGMAAWMALASTMPFAASAQDANPPPVPKEELPEVLTRGPVHEAFAEPVPLQNQEPVSVQPAPPPLIEEQPPEERPAGNEVWVPGYWAWDGDRNAYIWVSACWRVAPPGMYWVPGYWVQNGDRWEWVAGFWAPVQSQELEYLPPPPALADVNPTGPQPANSIWVAPCWYWYSGQYVLRPGYWLAAQPDWVWQPSYYIWTPRGYVFAPGHWDYELESRGILYAPVYFPRSYYSRPYVFTPSIVVDIGLLTGFLFVYPRYHHYCFGDYYDRSYIGFGIYPWFESWHATGWYDPIYRHHHWRHHDYHHDNKWEDRIREVYNDRVEHRDRRPPRTLPEWKKRVDRLPDAEKPNLRMFRNWNETEGREGKPARRLDPEARRRVTETSDEMRRLRRDRKNWESAETPSASGQPDTVRVPADAKPGDGRAVRNRADEETTGARTRPGAPVAPRDRRTSERDRGVTERQSGPVAPPEATTAPEPIRPPESETRPTSPRAREPRGPQVQPSAPTTLPPVERRERRQDEGVNVPAPTGRAPTQEQPVPRVQREREPVTRTPQPIQQPVPPTVQRQRESVGRTPQPAQPIPPAAPLPRERAPQIQQPIPPSVQQPAVPQARREVRTPVPQQPQVRVTQPERVRVPKADIGQPAPIPPGVAIPPEPVDESSHRWRNRTMRP